MNEKHTTDVRDLPMTVFEVAERGGTVESLTADHGMKELADSNCVCYICCGGPAA
ncbi:GE37468 family thiazolyl peptide [Rathayibacter sp. VKM Ac-2835]|uniref:thiomuracin/GE37468 family thiazolyl RiPP peptide n=1 Tax=Rathayibacter sp. VKM Ac-2835 TaxID=2739043 RepID=UPI00156468F5|nr:thiomuracin/GE37468 family thiazolyl RiPP peptide [Rathayibacter sp. VKM Ac-2835]NRG40363.1 GE37468 family thiazolyl peptide [Rathayibacter sp. VKM Ac-2835]